MNEARGIDENGDEEASQILAHKILKTLEKSPLR